MLPAYGAANLRGITPALTGPGFTRNLPPWFPSLAHGAEQVVLLVLDGLGWDQFQSQLDGMPVLAGFEGGPITTVAPSTTATALTSIVTGLAPGEHGLIGYRIEVSGEILNVLRWTTPRGDARQRLRPADVQPMAPFLGERVPVVSKIELAGSGFSEAHLRGVPLHGWRMPSNIPVQVRSLLEAGQRFVYVYYDGIDKTAHEYGFSAFYDQELRHADRLVADVLDALTPGTVLLVTAEHVHGKTGLDGPVLPEPTLYETRIAYLVSDFRHPQWDEQSQMRQLVTRLREHAAKLLMVQSAYTERPNMALTRLEPASGIRASGVETWMEVTVANYGEAPVSAVTRTMPGSPAATQASISAVIRRASGSRKKRVKSCSLRSRPNSFTRSAPKVRTGQRPSFKRSMTKRRSST